ncbi:DUF1287 domain-containing protein [Amylibacter sp. IMCC11727]|uniref:DUF1287 domain-containing protein n=1 Tax=Amylibacter sp. IMCC11727 TaxID=3039851 RepID=UPI00244DC46D|nr:DUF1287 domain-containing protein [Amylibacter sp. IMCC11727]WGI20799.1 DUF1287 domain-containing protein [Amylibacter sp. IMCC11727]
MIKNALFATAISLVLLTPHISQADTAFAQQTANAAASQIGVTTGYDPAYVSLDYPLGDLPRRTGVCTDVVIRALRDAHGIDLQERVHRDMKANFASYPKNWGLKRPDPNIDHRRVPNLRRYFERQGASLPISSDPSRFQTGDIVSWNLPGNLTHIGVVSANKSTDGTPLIIHNIGSGTREQDILFLFEITGHYRLNEAP